MTHSPVQIGHYSCLVSAGCLMLTLRFSLEDSPPVLCYSAYRPQVGDTISLPELGQNLGPLKVIDVSGNGFDNSQVSVRVRSANETQ